MILLSCFILMIKKVTASILGDLATVPFGLRESFSVKVVF